MNIIMHHGKQASEKEIIALEAYLKRSLSNSFKSFVRENDGAIPENNIFDVGKNGDSGINKFIPVKDIRSERKKLGDLPPCAYPVAWAEGGNYVVLDESKDGAVLYWDHEDSGALVMLASSFDDFLKILRRFDPDSVTLKPGQVTRAWIDPEFLKKLNIK